MLRHHAHRQTFAIVLGWSLLAPVFARAISPTQLSGSLNTEQGVRVLRLHGAAEARGYTHGFLLGEQIRDLVVGALLSDVVWGNVAQYELGVRSLVIPGFQFTADQEQELAGMLAGMRERVGAEGMRVARVNRDIDLIDLKALNIFADVQNAGCTTFAAWGPATSDGGTVVGRNLDFNRLPGIAETQLIIATTDAPAGHKRWLSVSWPGMIGAYTALNEEGVLVAMHDVRAPVDPHLAPFTPRALALRRIIETAGAADALAHAESVLRECRAFCGNNFLVATPYHGKGDAAAVFEFDCRLDLTGGVTRRGSDWKDHRLPEHTIACTNHYRMRESAVSCDRYAKVRRVLLDNPGKMNAERALQAQTAAAVGTTLHTVVALLNQREFSVSFCTQDKNATQLPAVRFTLDELLAAPNASAAPQPAGE